MYEVALLTGIGLLGLSIWCIRGIVRSIGGGE
jgi:hypothetical protein